MPHQMDSPASQGYPERPDWRYMITIIGIDPGLSTGFVVARNNEVVYKDTLGRAWAEDMYVQIKALATEDLYIVIEEAPMFGAHGQSILVNSVHSLCLEIMQTRLGSKYIQSEEFDPLKWGPYMVRPAEYKPLATARGWFSELQGTQHEKDAYAMAKWFWVTKLHGWKK